MLIKVKWLLASLKYATVRALRWALVAALVGGAGLLFAEMPIQLFIGVGL